MHAVAAARIGLTARRASVARTIQAACGEITMPRPVHFEIAVDDMERAKSFYSTVFGWSFQQYGDDAMPYWLTTTGPDGAPGINGGLRGRMPGEGPITVNTVGVASVDATAEAITAAGGQIVMPKMAIPGMGWVAYGTDTEGTMVGIFQEDSSAA
jgi:predicted enzyme related to lactoylglutathione lyase